MAAKKRDYRAERLRESKERKDARKARTKNRYHAIKEGKAKVGDGTHIDHKDLNPANNKKSNLRKISAKANMSRKKGKNTNSGTKTGRRKKHK